MVQSHPRVAGQWGPRVASEYGCSLAMPPGACWALALNTLGGAHSLLLSSFSAGVPCPLLLGEGGWALKMPLGAGLGSPPRPSTAQGPGLRWHPGQRWLQRSGPEVRELGRWVSSICHLLPPLV